MFSQKLFKNNFPKNRDLNKTSGKCKSLKQFKGEITELKTTIRKAKEVLSPKSAKSHALLYWEKMFRDGDIEDDESECIADALANARKELDDE